MRRVTDLHTPSPGQEVIGAAESVSIYGCQELGSRIAVEVWQPEGIGRDIPAWPKP